MSFISHRKRSGSHSANGSVTTDRFLGIDASECFGQTSVSRAVGKSYQNSKALPGNLNMIRDIVGQVKKRPGFKLIENPKSLDDQVDRIDGVFYYKGSETNQRYFYLVKDVIFVVYPSFIVEKILYPSLNLMGCKAIQSGNSMLFYNGSNLYIYDCKNKTETTFVSNLCSVTDPSMTYLPTTHIAGKPNGDAFAYQPANILNPFVSEQYIGDGQSKTFTVHFQLDFVHKVYLKNENGQWQETEYESSTANSVTFKSAPPKPTLTGEDNVRIVYRQPQKTFDFGRITNCTCATLFGVGGFQDRVFFSGNPYRPGYVYYSELNQPTYFPETNYIKVGTDATRVYSLAGQGVTLSVICNDNIYSVTGKGVSDNENTSYVENAQFSITDTLKTPMPVCHSAVIFDNEINYLTKEGVCAITTSGVMDERCCQIRSSYIGGFLKKENLSDCQMLSFGDFLVISNRKDTLYLLDGTQFSTSVDKPFSYRQYEGYIWQGIPAKYIWKHDERLCFSDGLHIYCFEKDFKSTGSYEDEVYLEGQLEKVPVRAFWETPEIYTGDFDKKKFFKSVGVLIGTEYKDDGSFDDTDVKIQAKFDSDDMRTVKDYDAAHKIFRYENIEYARFTYRSKPESFGFYKYNLHKKGAGVKFRFENANANEPFILKAFTVDYTIM